MEEWTKLNIYGVAKDNKKVGCGGFLEDNNGTCRGGFSKNIGTCNAEVVEFGEFIRA